MFSIYDKETDACVSLALVWFTEKKAKEQLPEFELMHPELAGRLEVRPVPEVKVEPRRSGGDLNLDELCPGE